MAVICTTQAATPSTGPVRSTVVASPISWTSPLPTSIRPTTTTTGTTDFQYVASLNKKMAGQVGIEPALYP